MGQEEEVKEVKPPIHIASDWNYFLKHVDGKNFRLISYFDKEDWQTNKVYRIRIGHIYDLSHFWVVSKEGEVDLLHKHLHQFYSKYKQHYKIPFRNFKINMYCVTHTEGAFYRAVLVNVPLATKSDSWVFAFLVDFGFMAKVPIEEVYFMTTKMYSVPQFAVRATLSGMGPVNLTTWSSEVVSKFSSLVSNKIVLCQVTNKNNAQKVLSVRLIEYNWQTRCLDSINDILVNERLAKQISVTDIREIKHSEKKKRTRRGKKIKFPFVLPTFDEIEKGVCFDSVVGNRFMEGFK